MSAQTQKVDVLAIMDETERSEMRDWSYAHPARVELRRARSAVAELIRAANAIDAAITCGKHEERINRSNPLSVETLRAALASLAGGAA